MYSSNIPENLTTEKHAHLILNGYLPLSFIENALKEKEAVYCTDGAYNSIATSQVPVCKVLGDFDSIDGPCTSEKFIHLPNQDYTDFEKSLNFLSKNYNSIDIYGANGKSMDHYLGNISTVKKYKEHLKLTLIDEYHFSWFPTNPTHLKAIKHKIISIVPMPIVAGLSTTGLQYPLCNSELSFGHNIGTRNYALSDEVSISWNHGDILLFVQNLKQ